MERYSRQMLFKPIGESGQKKLRNSSVLLVGAGALGTVIASHLVRAGIGRLTIVDRDYVELSNLQRQMLFDEEDVKQALPKAIAAKQKLSKMNSDVEIEAIIAHVDQDNLPTLVEDADLVLDGTDNFTTRLLLNDICFKSEKPFAYGGVVGSRGMSALFIPGQTACLRCFVKEGANEGETCDTVGVISPAVDMVASYQVVEVMKYLTGQTTALRQTLRTFDLWHNQQYDVSIKKPQPHCATCQEQHYPALVKKAKNQVITLCGRHTVQIHARDRLDLQVWFERLKPVAQVTQTPFLLKAAFTEGITLVLFSDGRVLVQGTDDVVVARTWYDKYIGS